MVIVISFKAKSDLTKREIALLRKRDFLVAKKVVYC